MAVYGPRCHPQNIIWTEAKLRSIYYFVSDRPVHKLPFSCHELFVISYSILANIDSMFFVIVYLRSKTSSDKIRKKTLYWRSLTKTNRENINVKYNIIQLFNGCGCNRPNYLSWGAGNDQVFYCMRPILRTNEKLDLIPHDLVLF
jgi:hypothetical protein